MTYYHELLCIVTIPHCVTRHKNVSMRAQTAYLIYNSNHEARAVGSSGMASKAFLCRLCSGSADKNSTNLFTRKSLERGWATRISTLLDVPVSQHDFRESVAHTVSKVLRRTEETIEEEHAGIPISNTLAILIQNVDLANDCVIVNGGIRKDYNSSESGGKFCFH